MNNANEMLLQAIARLEYANEELNRPDEDVMALALCQQARSIIGDLFSSFLLMNGKDISSAHDLATLKKMSAELDPKFAGVKLEGMFCYPGRITSETGYCMDLSHVKRCIGIANELKEMLMSDFRLKVTK